MALSALILLTSVTGYVLAFALLGKRLRLIAEARDTVSLPDAVAARYGSETTRGLCALAIALGVLGYLATQILALATVLRDVIGAGVGTELSLAASLAINLGLELFAVRLPWGIHGGVVAMLVSMALFLGISLASDPPRLAPDIAAVLDV